MLEKLADDKYGLPLGEQPPTEVPESSHSLRITDFNGCEVVAYYINKPIQESDRYVMCNLRRSYYKLPQAEYAIAGKGEELLYWDKNTQYCGACGAPMQMSTDISKTCSNCKREVWPQLSTAIIVLVHNADKVLLVRAKNFSKPFFGLVAGFVETGETLEEAVRREVLEETGIEIANITYFASQPWPYPCGLMVGFNADYVSGNIQLQASELTDGGWFDKDNLPQIPEKLSIARRLIDAWLEG